MNTPTHPQPDLDLVAKITAEIKTSDREPEVVDAAAMAVAQAVADIDPVFVAEAADKADGSLRVDVWETAMVKFGDALPEQLRETWEQESGAAWQGAAGGGRQLQDVLAAAVEVAVSQLG